MSLFLIDEEQSHDATNSNKVLDKKGRYHKLSIKELDTRLMDHISRLSAEEKRVLILFLDAVK